MSPKKRGVRIIGGSLRGRRLEVPDGLEVRPMRSRIRESLFQIIGDDLVGARFLDVFAGSGAIGAEALSRGARRTTYVETSPRVLPLLRRNLDALALTTRSSIVTLDPYRDPIPGGLYDCVFMDPPFGDYESEVHDPWQLLFRLGQELLTEGGLAGLEYPSRCAPPQAAPGLVEQTRRRYGDTAIALWRRSDR